MDPLSQPQFLVGADGESRGVLLVHGFSGSPFELHLVAERLHQQGLHVALPLLAGHHQNLRALGESRWPDWLASAEQLTRLLLPRSFHILPLDVERELLLTALTEHLSRHLAPLPERA